MYLREYQISGLYSGLDNELPWKESDGIERVPLSLGL